MERSSARGPGERALSGWRVLNTRAAADASGFSIALRAAGAEPVELPATHIGPPDDTTPLDAAIRALVTRDTEVHPAFDWVAFTSAHAVDFFVARLAALGRDKDVLSRCHIAAVGPGTAARLALHGLAADLVPDRAAGRHLAAAMDEIAGQRVLLPRSDVALRDLPDALAARGATVIEVVAYVTRPATPTPQEVDAALRGTLDAAAFFSPSGVDGLAAIVAPLGLTRVLGPAVIVCIGRTTADAALRRGLNVNVAEESTLEGVVAELIRARQAG